MARSTSRYGDVYFRAIPSSACRSALLREITNGLLLAIVPTPPRWRECPIPRELATVIRHRIYGRKYLVCGVTRPFQRCKHEVAPNIFVFWPVMASCTVTRPRSTVSKATWRVSLWHSSLKMGAVEQSSGKSVCNCSENRIHPGLPPLPDMATGEGTQAGAGLHFYGARMNGVHDYCMAKPGPAIRSRPIQFGQMRELVRARLVPIPCHWAARMLGSSGGRGRSGAAC